MNFSHLVGGEKQVVRPFVVLDSMEVECLGTVFYLFIRFPSIFVKEKYHSSRCLLGSCQIVGTSNSIFFFPLSNLSGNSILFFTFIHFMRLCSIDVVPILCLPHDIQLTKSRFALLCVC